MQPMINKGGLRIHPVLYDLVENEIAPGTGVDPESFWQALGAIVADLAPVNAALLEKRNVLQRLIDQWHRDHPHATFPSKEYENFLIAIGYLLPEGEDFAVETQNVDPEISIVAGPQLVVPTDNPRYALNAANARWGSLYDAFYGSNVIPETAGRAISGTYNPVRGDAVIARSNAFLDSYFPLREGKYAEVVQYCLSGPEGDKALVMQLAQGGVTPLADPSQFTGFAQCEDELTNIWLAHNGLHVEIQIDPLHPVGRSSPSGVKDIILEAAVTTIQDFEDSVSAVDARDKARVYGNWNGIMKGVLETTFQKNGQLIERRLNPDKSFTTPRGKPATLPGRSLMLARNVGMHIYTHAVTTRDGHPIPEGFLDAMVSTLAALHDLKGLGRYRNSRSGSFYIVKPKLHGPEEVEFTARLFGRVEEAVGLPAHTLKMGIMDEERRTTVNLKACIRAAKERIVFINTGFLDRTGDEIHTSMEAGPIIPKLEIKDAPWMLAYEDWNVDVGIETRLPGRGQIGKGMWTIPDDLKTMVETKGVHPEAGASTAWVPSPTAATLHAIHYHQIDVAQRQEQLAARPRADLQALLTPPLLHDRILSREEIDRELENNAQGILGYVVRWIDQGVGCSKVPDYHNVGLMEDRATLRISSQHLANWLCHRVVRKEEILQVFKKMAAVVDRQNAADPDYRNMAPRFDRSIAFQAALDLVFSGAEEPNGYTETVLHQRRKALKSR
ncbi:MAG: malate synthase G [Opitutae bacterium]|nr:malate synthase G [Opitutae bacterium]